MVGLILLELVQILLLQGLIGLPFLIPNVGRRQGADKLKPPVQLDHQVVQLSDLTLIKRQQPALKVNELQKVAQ